MISISVPNISNEAQVAFTKHKQKINETLVTRLLTEHGQFDHLGDQAESILMAGSEFTSSNLEACMLMNDSSLLIDQLRWAKDRLPHDGINMDRMLKNLDVYCEVITEFLPEAYSREIVNLVKQMITVAQEIMKDN